MPTRCPALAKEPGGADDRFEVGQVSTRIGGGVGVASEQLRRDRVDSAIRGLGRQDRCHEQVQRRAEVELQGMGVHLPQCRIDRRRLLHYQATPAGSIVNSTSTGASNGRTLTPSTALRT